MVRHSLRSILHHIALIGLLLAGCAAPKAEPPLAVPPEGPTIAVNVFLSAEGPRDPEAVFDLPSVPRRATEVTLHALGPRPLAAKLSCDGPARLLVDGENRFLRPQGTRAFTLPPRREAPAGAVRAVLSPEVTECHLSWGNGWGDGWGDGARMRLQTADLSAPALHRIDSFRDSCADPAPGADRLTRAFYANTALAQSCALPLGDIAFAPEPLDGINARIEALTGQRWPRAKLESGDPAMAIDFSRAPKLDLIVLSSFYLRADYSGALMRRAIEYHAARGTRVRLLGSANSVFGPDRAFWESLAARYPNVQIQYLSWAPQGFGDPSGLINRLQRANHTKLFLAVSPTPGQSRFITGGRNQHDGYFFGETFDLTEYPGLRTYRNGKDGFAWHSVYEDFEIVMRGDRAVRGIARHFSTLWHRDRHGTVAVPMTRPGGAARPAEGQANGRARHFISYPFADGHALEAAYVALIDAAEHEILAISPFLYPTDAIRRALERAAARGVKVALVSRLASTDPPAFFTRTFTEAFQARTPGFDHWNYEPEKRLMHTKLLVIDRRLSVVGSTNLNRRSFLHDTENGVVILDRAVSARLAGLVERYIRASRPGSTPATTPARRQAPAGGVLRALMAQDWFQQYF